MNIRASNLRVIFGSLLAAAALATGPSAGASEAARASIERTVATVDSAQPARSATRIRSNVEQETERSCRPITRLGGKVRIARRGPDCAD
ncbi:MAG TPA: hypothetical protein VLT59_15480 [Steroidobacteraceae bacterium]|nr:hypothetical protein [Steroidobacteraceae bacterium]